MKRWLQWLKRRFCAHTKLTVCASTAARRSSPLNVDFGATICCEKCGRRWVDDIRVGCLEAWGEEVIDTLS